MATYDVNGVDTLQFGIDGLYLGVNENIKNVTDEQTDSEWKIGDTVKVEFNDGTKHDGHYRGTFTIDGTEYPVIEISQEFYVLGSGSVTPIPTYSLLTHTDYNTSSANTFTVCFFPGTLIATPHGVRKVENLVPGDPVFIGDPGTDPATWTGRMARNLRRRFGFRRTVPVKWLGRQTVSTHFGPAERLMPVRFAAGSLGGGGATPSAA